MTEKNLRATSVKLTTSSNKGPIATKKQPQRDTDAKNLEKPQHPLLQTDPRNRVCLLKILVLKKKQYRESDRPYDKNDAYAGQESFEQEELLISSTAKPFSEQAAFRSESQLPEEQSRGPLDNKSKDPQGRVRERNQSGQTKESNVPDQHRKSKSKRRAQAKIQIL
jgi:hypothetical protein